MGFVPSKILGFERVARFFFYVHNIIQVHLPIFCMPHNQRSMKNIVSAYFSVIIIYHIYIPFHTPSCSIDFYQHSIILTEVFPENHKTKHETNKICILIIHLSRHSIQNTHSYFVIPTPRYRSK